MVGAFGVLILLAQCMAKRLPLLVAVLQHEYVMDISNGCGYQYSCCTVPYRYRYE